MDMLDGWWYDPECGSPEHAACMYVTAGTASMKYLDRHTKETGHVFVRVVPR